MTYPRQVALKPYRRGAGISIAFCLAALSGCASSTTNDEQNSTSIDDASGTTTSSAHTSAGTGVTSSSALTSNTNVPTTAQSTAGATSSHSDSTSNTSETPDTTNLGPSDETSSPTSNVESTDESVNDSTAQSSNSSASSASTSTADVSSSSDETSDVDLTAYAEGFAGLTIHDACTGPNPGSPDTCIHEQLHEQTVVFGGEAGTVYDVELHVRGLFEPTNITGGTTPYPEYPYFKVDGTVNAADYSQWQIEVSDPAATYWLNHYPNTGHIIYKEDFTCVIPIAAMADVSVRVVDGNNRMIDNGATGLADRQQTIEGVTDGVMDGQILRLDVESVTAH